MSNTVFEDSEPNPIITLDMLQKISDILSKQGINPDVTNKIIDCYLDMHPNLLKPCRHCTDIQCPGSPCIITGKY